MESGLFAVSDTVWNSAIAALVTALLAYLQFKSRRDILAEAREAREHHRLHETVSLESEKKLGILVQQSNGVYEELLRGHAQTARMLADATNEREHIELAKQAEKALEDYLRSKVITGDH